MVIVSHVELKKGGQGGELHLLPTQKLAFGPVGVALRLSKKKRKKKKKGPSKAGVRNCTTGPSDALSGSGGGRSQRASERAFGQV